MRAALAAAGALAALAVAAPALAQGHGRGHGPGTPPSQNSLAPPVTQTSGGASPFAWLEDASILEPGVSAALSVSRWQGTDVSEVDLPVVELGVGLADRVHLAASVPRVVDGATTGGPIGGVGTSFFTAKIAILDGSRSALKVSASPTLELLGDGVVHALGADARRVQFGLPVSAELDRGPVRWFAGGGYFSGGIWFGGAGAGVRASRRVFVSASLTRSWRHDDTAADPTLAARDRTDLSGGIAYAVTPRVSAFASAGHTIATTDADGAGATISAGLSLFLPPARK